MRKSHHKIFFPVILFKRAQFRKHDIEKILLFYEVTHSLTSWGVVFICRLSPYTNISQDRVGCASDYADAVKQ